MEKARVAMGVETQRGNARAAMGSLCKDFELLTSVMEGPRWA